MKDDFDWDAYLRSNFQVKQTSSSELRICCFACGDTDYKLYVNPTKRKFQCFKCGFTSGKYDVFMFVAKAEGIPKAKAMSRLISEFGAVTPEDDEFVLALQKQDLEAPVSAKLTAIKPLKSLPPQAILLSSRTEESAPFWDYAISRGLTSDEILSMRLHYVPNTKPAVVYGSDGRRKGDIANRILWPVYGGDRELVSWQARIIDPDHKGHDKYLSAPESELSKTLWPYVKPTSNRVVLVEGVLDCVSVRRAYSNTYATFSKKVSPEQMLRLKLWGVKEIVLLWDKKDAKKDMERAVKDLQMFCDRVFVSHMRGWPKTQDAGSLLADPLGTDKIKRILDIDQLVDTYDSLEYAKWSLMFDTE